MIVAPIDGVELDSGAMRDLVRWIAEAILDDVEAEAVAEASAAGATPSVARGQL